MHTDYNKKLCQRFPFLIPRNRFTNNIVDGYAYHYTELDSMPYGWRKAFGEQMCEEIREELLKYDALDKYRILQIKEKYGSLRWYDGGSTEKITREIIPKYENMSTQICINCGEKAVYTNMDFGIPLCKECYESRFGDE